MIQIRVPNDNNTYEDLNKTPPRKNFSIKDGYYPRSHGPVILDVENPEDCRHVRQLTFHTPAKRKSKYLPGNSYKTNSYNKVDYTYDNEMSIEDELDAQENFYYPQGGSINRMRGYLNHSDVKLSNRASHLYPEPRYETESAYRRPVYRSRIFVPY